MDKNLQQLIKNINKFKWGLLQIERDSIISVNNKLVQIIKTDHEGHLYFFASANFNNTAHPNKKFYANINFEEKGYAQKIQTTGYVCSVDNYLDDSFVAQLKNLDNLLLFKFKILKVEVTEFNKGYPSSLSTITNLLISFRKNS